MVKSRFKVSTIFISLYAAVYLICLLSACSSTNSKPLLVTFSPDSTSIVFRNIDKAGLLHLKNTNASDSILNELVSVLQTPSESDSTLREVPLEGKILLMDTSIVFTPKLPFVKGRDYLVITYLNSRFGTSEKVIKSQMNTGIRPHQIVLTK